MRQFIPVDKETNNPDKKVAPFNSRLLAQRKRLELGNIHRIIETSINVHQQKTVKLIKKKHKKPRICKKLTSERYLAMVELSKQGHTICQIGEKYGRTGEAIRQYIKPAKEEITAFRETKKLFCAYVLAWIKSQKYWHGTCWQYNTANCRCDKCRAFNNKRANDRYYRIKNADLTNTVEMV